MRVTEAERRQVLEWVRDYPVGIGVNLWGTGPMLDGQFPTKYDAGTRREYG